MAAPITEYLLIAFAALLILRLKFNKITIFAFLVSGGANVSASNLNFFAHVSIFNVAMQRTSEIGRVSLTLDSVCISMAV